MHIWFHLIGYVEENRDLMETILKGPLEVRSMSLDVYLKKMRNCETCGYEITLLILTNMYEVPILVICSDMLWLSSNVTAIDCPIVLVQNSSGQFLGTKTKYLVFVGNLPKITFPKTKRSKSMKVTELQHSMPLRDVEESDKNFGTGQEILSPIGGKQEINSGEVAPTDNSKDTDMAAVRKSVQIFEEANLSTTVDEGNSKTNDCSMSTEYPEHNVMESSITLMSEITPADNIDSSTVSSVKHVEADSTDIVGSKPPLEPNVVIVSSSVGGGGVSRSENSVSGPSEVLTGDGADGSGVVLTCSVNSAATVKAVCDDGGQEYGVVPEHTINSVIAVDVIDSTVPVTENIVQEETSAVTEDPNEKSKITTTGYPEEKTLLQEDKVTDSDRTITATNDEGDDRTITATNDEGDNSDETKSYCDEDEEQKEDDSTLVPDVGTIQFQTVKKRLGVTGPEKKKFIVKITLKDIKKDVGMDLDCNSSFTLDTEKEDKLVSYACNKCKYTCFTRQGYETHMFHSHRVCNVENYPPTIIKRKLGRTDEHSDKLEPGRKDETVNSAVDSVNESDDSGAENSATEADRHAESPSKDDEGKSENSASAEVHPENAGNEEATNAQSPELFDDGQEISHSDVAPTNSSDTGANRIMTRRLATEWADLKYQFKCDQCDAKFMYKDTYDLHAKDHLDQLRPYRCEDCPESFFYEGGAASPYGFTQQTETIQFRTLR